MAAKEAGEFDAIHFGHHVIEDNEVWKIFPGHLQPLFTIGGLDDLVVVEEGRDVGTHAGFVVDNEDA